MSDSASNSETSKTQGLLSHLIELRDRLLRSTIVIGIFFVVLFPFAKKIYDWLAAPLVNQGQDMLIIGPVAPFLIPMKLALMVSFLIALPYVFYQIWAFVAPGLYKHEKRLVYPLIASSIFLFYLGIAFVYYLLLPMMFKIIPQFAPEVATFSPDIAQYLDFTIMMFMAFGLGFEMPIATILLISTGMTTAEDLKKKRPYVIVGAFVVGMILTPPDVVSQIMLAIPMWLLFELGLIFSKFFNVRIEQASDARKEMDAEENKTSTASTAAVATAPVLSADTLWEDDDNHYEEDYDESDNEVDEDFENRTNHSEYQDSDSFDTDSSENPFNEEDNFEELSDEEMDAELDAIEAEELAEETKEKALKKKPATKKKTSAKRTSNKRAATKKTSAKKTGAKKTSTKKKTLSKKKKPPKK